MLVKLRMPDLLELLSHHIYDRIQPLRYGDDLEIRPSQGRENATPDRDIGKYEDNSMTFPEAFKERGSWGYEKR